MNEYLRSTHAVDWSNTDVFDLACSLAVENSPLKTAARCFHWVRDEISHSFDIDTQCVSCTASGTLRNRTGICYAKSHLLAALLRANGIPAGFGYQRLSLDDSGTTFCLHGFNYVHLGNLDWYAVDARGNREGINTHFDPPLVSLAFEPRLPGERTFSKIFADPLDCIVASLEASKTLIDLRRSLPDYDL